ncbi:hypothetical protein [Aliamphritea hakodatensis]|nr:hypothetical protein [Aliamphritea hakodatensis]
MEQRYQQQIAHTYYLTTGSLRLLEAALTKGPKQTVSEPEHKCCANGTAK